MFHDFGCLMALLKISYFVFFFFFTNYTEKNGNLLALYNIFRFTQILTIHCNIQSVRHFVVCFIWEGLGSAWTLGFVVVLCCIEPQYRSRTACCGWLTVCIRTTTPRPFYQHFNWWWQCTLKRYTLAFRHFFISKI